MPFLVQDSSGRRSKREEKKTSVNKKIGLQCTVHITLSTPRLIIQQNGNLRGNIEAILVDTQNKQEMQTSRENMEKTRQSQRQLFDRSFPYACILCVYVYLFVLVCVCANFSTYHGFTAWPALTERPCLISCVYV